MPRYYRYKRSYRKIYPRKRWASNIGNYTTIVTVNGGSAGGNNTYTICENSAQNSTPTPVILKFGRIKLKGDVRYNVTDAANFTSAIMYVVFVPQGNTLTAQFIGNHPEYILGWTTISMDSGNTFSLTSSLKRNLNSGDSIQLYIGVSNAYSVQASINYSFFYNVQFWTTSA